MDVGVKSPFSRTDLQRGRNTPSPTGFQTKHPSDTKTCNEVEKLLKKDVVDVPKSRIDDGDLFRLAAIAAKQLLLEKYDDTNYGYLRIRVDKEQLRIGFHQVGASTLAQSRYDMVTVDLAEHIMVSN